MVDNVNLPYSLYEWQELALKFLESSKSKLKILESPTGSGKTLISLYYALKHCQKCKIIFLTRTNSQVENIFRESKLMGLTGVISFMGRGEMCLFKRQSQEMREGDPEEQSRLCQRLVQDKKEGRDGCFYDTDYDMGWFADIIRPTDLIDKGEKFGFCPYYAQRELLKEAKVIVTTYSYILNEFIRERFLEWADFDLSNTIIIFDEAHNIPDYLRNMKSYSLSFKDIEKANDEVNIYGDKTVHNISLSLVISSIEESLEYIFDEGSRLLSSDDAREAFMKGFSSGTVEIKRILESMEFMGEGIKEIKLNEGKLPRSYIHKLAKLCQLLLDDTEADFVRIVDYDERQINLKYLDISNNMKFLNNLKEIIFMSGTISPFEKFKDELGLESADTVSIGVPYLETNLKVLYTDKLNLSYINRNENEPKLFTLIEDFLNKTNYNTVVFTTSYEELSKIRDLNIRRKIYFERKNISNVELNEMLNSFKKNGGVLLGVINGRLSEGLDLPGKLLEVALIAGIPYPKPTPETYAMETYYDMKFKKGWLYAYEAVASVRLRQALGRIIRSPMDRGVAIILDARARKFKKVLPNLYLSEDLIGDTVTFLSQ